MSAKMNWNGVLSYLLAWALARLQESGTWAGFAGLLVAANIHVDTTLWNALAQLGIAFFSAIAVLKRDPGSSK